MPKLPGWAQWAALGIALSVAGWLLSILFDWQVLQDAEIDDHDRRIIRLEVPREYNPPR